MARDNNNWLSFSVSSAAAAVEMQRQQPPPDSHHFFSSFADNFYANGWANQIKPQSMFAGDAMDAHHHHQVYLPPATQWMPPKLEDFFPGDSTTETQDSSLTHIHHQPPPPPYFTAATGGVGGGGDHQDLNTLTVFQAAFSSSGSEVDDSAFAGQTQSPVESAAEFAAPNSNAISIGVNNHQNAAATAIVAADSDACKKTADTFGQRTSIYRGVTRHRWTGRYEAHLWDNSCRREGQARKGRQGGYDKEDKAARAYDLAALKYWGPTATTNFPISNYTKEMEEMKNVTKQEFIASLRRKSSGFSRGASIYRGVTRHHQQGRWQARIGRVAGNKDLYLGTFATEEEAAEAYDIAAIKFRGLNAVTNFEMSRYDIEAIAKSPLPIGGTSKRLKLSLESEENLPLSTVLQTPYNNNNGSNNNISFSNIPCGLPFDSSSPFYHHNLFHHLHSGNLAGAPDATNNGSSLGIAPAPSPPEFFIWPHQSY
ncbi:AP2-like ethylene-responsive transcription factor AIL6 isoform X2 [Andrographis paniculata]|uniref:AP2-like ethylene-responsive transcription factor AIL6 isoform X2 n=1 Tax=Andrographis paniculata TaxID=175694 RepID=UPI0021E80D5B|nr:AP2-like ethylene-responsive transcription factor AIL6 isoform X2 [Andrographis paniculata]